MINQPNFMPTMHYFEQIHRADVFVIYDDVQYTRSDWRNRNRIRTKTGWQWLTVPVINRLGQKINETMIDNHTDWKTKHCNLIIENYSKAPYFESYWQDIKKIYSKNLKTILVLDIYAIKKLCDLIGIDYHFELSSFLGIEGEKTERLVNICQDFSADTYYSPKKSETYLNLNDFNKVGINVEFQNYEHPVYPQSHGGEFIPYMSVIDLIFNCGEASKWWILNQKQEQS